VTLKKFMAALGASLPIVILIIAGVVGLAVVAYFVLVSIALSSWGSNK
jgi:hypothetical protein